LQASVDDDFYEIVCGVFRITLSAGDDIDAAFATEAMQECSAIVFEYEFAAIGYAFKDEKAM
jgi:hypothetical protein